MRRIKTTEYTVDNGVPESLKGKCIAFLSDYHEAAGGLFEKDILRILKEEKPECVLLGGDMLNSNEDPSDDLQCLKLINAMAKKHKVFYAYGNHEKKLSIDYYDKGVDFERFLKRLDPRVTVLRNDNVRLFDDVYIYGLDIPIEFYGRIHFPDLNKSVMAGLLGKKPEDAYTILLAHTPDFIKGYSGWGADLILAGHFHGGMVRLPLLGGVISPRLRLFPKYDYGLYKEGNAVEIVTNGVGQHSVKIKINNCPEVVIVRFK
ncbi:MAG: metallophosphoesterase [Eubacterium sp.]|nr:metallophosphoesterase [Eubacterium sp.]